MSLNTIILVLFYLLAPALILSLGIKLSFIKKIGAVLICYFIGLILGNIGIIPDPDEIGKVQEGLRDGSVILALPMILFTLNIKQLFNQAGKVVLSLFIGLIAVVVMIMVSFYLFAGEMDNSWQIAGMLVGIYTGGTPNLAAIAYALGVDNELYIMTHTYELFLGAIYLLFVLSIGQRVFLKFLLPYRQVSSKFEGDFNIENDDEFASYVGIFNRKTFVPLLISFGLSVLILIVSFGLSKLVPVQFESTIIILSVTTFSILLSLNDKIRNLKRSFQGGMYLILIFCIVVASMADISMLQNISFKLFYFIAIALFGSLIVQVILSRVFKIDADTMIITSTALICSPPFVPVVAGAIKNKNIILAGISIGIVGYAIGNFVGVFLAYFLK